LHERQRTTIPSRSVPPFERGTTWSPVRSRVAPQSTQTGDRAIAALDAGTQERG
jgi:hypothetical protein